jgi:hypothetical protein
MSASQASTPPGAPNQSVKHVADLTFDGVAYDLSALSEDSDIVAAASKSHSIFNMAVTLLRYNDKQLERIVRQDPQAHLKLLEWIVSEAKLREHQSVTLQCVETRLAIVLKRLVGD